MYMKGSNYFEERNIASTIKLREKLSVLPYFCREFFIGIEMKTSTLTRLNYATDLKIFFDYLTKEVPYFKDKAIGELELSDLDKVTTTDIEMFLSYLSYYEIDNRKYSNKERAKSRKLSTVRSLFAYFYNKDKLKENVSSKVSLPKLHEKEIIRLNAEESKDLINLIEDLSQMHSEHQRKYIKNNLKNRDLAIIALLLGTGIRVSELVGLNIDDFDFKNNAFVVTRKGGDRSTLFFSNEIKEILYDYVQARKEIHDAKNKHALFLSSQKRRITVRAVEYLVKKYSKIISPQKKITPHKLRSTYGTNLYRATKDIYVVAEVLGHKDVNTTKKHYAATSEEIKREASTKVRLR